MNKQFMSFVHIMVSEIIKLRSTFAMWLTFLYPLGTVFLVNLFWFSRRNNANINTDQFITDLGNVASFFLPFLLCF